MSKSFITYAIQYCWEKINLLRDIQKAEAQIRLGKVVKHETTRRKILENLEKH